jgi:hypothetical protein
VVVLESKEAFMKRALLLSCISLGLRGCASLPGRTPPFTSPDASQIQAIVVSPVFGDDQQARRIVDRGKIDAFVQFIHRKDSGWKPLRDTLPAGRYLVRVQGRNEDLVHFRIGRGLITCGRQDKCPITAEEWAELKEILKIAVD